MNGQVKTVDIKRCQRRIVIPGRKDETFIMNATVLGHDLEFAQVVAWELLDNPSLDAMLWIEASIQFKKKMDELEPGRVVEWKLMKDAFQVTYKVNPNEAVAV